MYVRNSLFNGHFKKCLNLSLIKLYIYNCPIKFLIKKNLMKSFDISLNVISEIIK